jgi:hypothetical protein
MRLCSALPLCRRTAALVRAVGLSDQQHSHCIIHSSSTTPPLLTAARNAPAPVFTNNCGTWMPAVSAASCRTSSCACTHEPGAVNTTPSIGGLNERVHSQLRCRGCVIHFWGVSAMRPMRSWQRRVETYRNLVLSIISQLCARPNLCLRHTLSHLQRSTFVADCQTRKPS